jgi:hypothetical protein
MSRRPRATIQELREAVQCLPRVTRIAMLEGLDAGPIIAGAYTSDDGICPMLAAHRAGGRCSAAFFADAWDRFAFRDGRGRRAGARRVNERELRILRMHLEASLLDEELADASLAGALREHQELLARRESLARRELLARRQSVVDEAPPADRRRQLSPKHGTRRRPGDRDRAAELRGRTGWAWSRLFRRYDEYEAALVHLHAAADVGAPLDDVGAPPDRRSDGAETVNT